jgi:spore coat polysaccharide biosynthesis predicted glycosyltransferase SpsG
LAKTKKIIFITEKNKKIGNGHFNRSKELFKVLKNHINIKFFLLKNIKKKDIKSAKLILLDLKNFSILKKKWINKKKIITIENFSKYRSSLNISIFDQSPHKKGLRKSGLKYAIIREKIKNVNKKSNIGREGSPIISLGSFDRNNYLKKLKNNSNLIDENFKVFPGPYAKKTLNLKKNFKIASEKNYEKFLTQAPWCIVNGGLTLIECLYLKKPVFAFPQNKNEKKFITMLYNKGYILGNSISKIYVPNKKNLRMVEKKIKKLVDGKGSMRITKLIKKND